MNMGQLNDHDGADWSILNSIPAPFLIYNHHFKVCFWNQALANCFTKSIHLFEGALLQDAFPELQNNEFRDHLQDALKGHQNTFLIDFSERSNSTQKWELTAAPFPSGKSTSSFALLYFRETVQQAFSQKFQFDPATLGLETWDAILVTDSQVDYPGPRIVYVNHAFTQMTGYNSEEVLGQTPRIFQGPDTDQEVMKRLRSCLENGDYFEGETWNYRKDGTPFLLHWKVTPMRDKQGYITNYIAIQRDYSQWRKAKEQIKETEERYRKLVDYSPIALLVHKDGIIKYANNEAANLLKVKSSLNLLGENIYHYIHPDYRGTAFDRVSYVQEQQVSVNKMEQRFIRKDGEAIDVEALAIPFQLDGNNCVQSVLKDVTDQKALEQLLEETQEIARVGGWSYHLAQDELSWTPKVYDLFEIPRNTAIDIPYALSFFSTENGNQDLLSERLNLLIQQGKPFDLELRFHTAKGRKLWVRSIGKPYWEAGELVKIGGTFQDITAEKEAQLERDRIFNYSLDIMMTVSMDGYVKQVNPQTEHLLGWQSEELQDQYIFNFLHPEDKPETKSAHFNMVEESREVTAFENRFLCKNGTYKWLSWHAVPVFEDQVVYGFARDVTEKREYEDYLLYNQTLLEQIFNESVDALFLVKLGQGIIEKCNATALTLFEANNYDELIGKYGPSLHKHPLSEHHLEEIRESLRATRTFRHEYEMETLNGKTFWASVALKLFELQGEQYELVSVRNVTERKKAQQALLEKQEFIEKITYHSPSFINIYDYESNEMIYTNRDIIASLGYNDQELEKVRQNPRSLCHPDDLEAIQRHHEQNRQLRDGEVNTLEFRLKHKNDYWVWLLNKDTVFKRNEKGEVVQVMGVIQDTTEQKQIEESLRQSEALFRQLFQNAPLGIVMVDRNYQIEAVNRGFEEIFGFSNETAKNRYLNELIVPEGYKEEASSISKETMKGETHWKASYRCNKEGQLIPVLIYGVPVLQEKGGGEPVTIFGIYVDISERKKIEDDLKQRTNELLRSNAELEQFAYVTSHNLRSPVINLKSLTQLFDPENIEDTENQYLFEKITESVTQLDDTLNDLVQIVAQKKELSNPKQLLNFQDIYEEVRNSLAHQIDQAGAKIFTDFSQAPNIYYIKSFLISIFQNLLTNAVKYRSPSRDLEVEIKTFPLDHYLMLKFSDNGIGINLAEYGDQLFSLYKRFHKQGEGKGLGLYIIKSQVESLGGYVTIDSEEEKGTTFQLYLKDFAQGTNK